MKAEMSLHKTYSKCLSVCHLFCLMNMQWVLHHRDLPLKVEHKYQRSQKKCYLIYGPYNKIHDLPSNCKNESAICLHYSNKSSNFVNSSIEQLRPAQILKCTTKDHIAMLCLKKKQMKPQREQAKTIVEECVL